MIISFHILFIFTAHIFRSYALLVMKIPSLTSLGLRSLRNINDGSVYITGNKKLCYLDTVNWTRILTSSSRPHRRNKLVDVKDNRPRNQCGEWGRIFWKQAPLSTVTMMLIVFLVIFSVNESHVCDPLCSNGCWGPGPSQCLSCKKYSRGGVCVPDCMFLMGYAFTFWLSQYLL